MLRWYYLSRRLSLSVGLGEWLLDTIKWSKCTEPSPETNCNGRAKRWFIIAFTLWWSQHSLVNTSGHVTLIGSNPRELYRPFTVPTSFVPQSIRVIGFQIAHLSAVGKPLGSGKVSLELKWRCQSRSWGRYCKKLYNLDLNPSLAPPNN